MISNEVRTALGKFPDIVVMGRNSTRKYKGQAGGRPAGGKGV